MSTIARQALTEEVRTLAHAIGFNLVRFTSALPFAGLEQDVCQRIGQGLYANLPWFTPERAYMAGDIRRIVPPAQSIISLGLAYPSGNTYLPSTPGVPRGRVARYAWGRDYHRVVRRLTQRFIAELRQHFGHKEAQRGWVDTARLVERAVAARAGLGWVGKNSCLLTSEYGSWVLLAEVATDLDLEPDAPVRKTCGRCARCLPSCPTNALPAPGVLDATQCISALTIEARGAIPRTLRPKIGDWIFGCDICQEVCPVNRGKEVKIHPDLLPERGCGPSIELLPLFSLSPAAFTAQFQGTSLMRTRREGLLRNACVALGNIADPAAAPVLCTVLAQETSALVREHACWALGRISSEQLVRQALAHAARSDPDLCVRQEAELSLDLGEVHS